MKGAAYENETIGTKKEATTEMLHSAKFVKEVFNKSFRIFRSRKPRANAVQGSSKVKTVQLRRTVVLQDEVLENIR